MDQSAIYRDKSPSIKSKATLAAIHFLIVLAVLWILFGVQHQGSSGLRRSLLAAVAILYFTRVLGTLFVFIKRKVGWSEVATIAVWVGFIDILIAHFGAMSDVKVGVWTLVGGLMVLTGSAVNTGSEWQRMVWKRRPENKGHLYTGGMWGLSRHVNYFGDIVLFTGWVLMSGQPALLIIPVVMFGGFAFGNIPAQDRYLLERYGEEYKLYEKSTARLIPFIF